MAKKGHSHKYLSTFLPLCVGGRLSSERRTWEKATFERRSMDFLAMLIDQKTFLQYPPHLPSRFPRRASIAILALL